MTVAYDVREGDVNLSPRRDTWQRAHVGPAAQALLDRDQARFLRQSLSTPCLSAIRHAAGIWIEDMDGRRFMDFHGNSAHHIGYGHPRLIQALKDQLDSLPFAPRRFTCEPAVELAERLTAVAPAGLERVLFAPGGSEAIEIALKLARIATGRFKTLSFWDAFHGAGFGAVSVGGEALFRSHGIGPLLAGTEHVAPFACYRCPYGFPSASGAPDLDACRMACARMVRYVLEKEGDIAAVIAEPVRAVPYLPPPGFWAEVRRACDDHGALLIFDEIPTGLGKTGTLFASEQTGVVPDLLVVGKALGGGVLPIAATLARPSLDRAADKALGHYTHEKNPVLCRAALVTLDIIRDEGLVERAASLGRHAVDRLRESARHRPLIGEIRGAGLLIGIELVTPDGAPAVEAADAALYAALSRGLSFKVTMGSVLTLSPPLTIARDELDHALDIIDACLDDVAALAGHRGLNGAAAQ
ncbi:MAG: aspartate aminotransferase family protein [Azospirillaceae bacterium]|nr:aspartate aminotransferase family protein [Azospirillaceae bacterium]